MRSPIEDAAIDPLASQQILQKNFSTTSISSQSAPFSTSRVTGQPQKTYTGYTGGLSNNPLQDQAETNDAEMERTAERADVKKEEEPIAINQDSDIRAEENAEDADNILPVKYTQPS